MERVQQIVDTLHLVEQTQSRLQADSENRKPHLVITLTPSSTTETVTLANANTLTLQNNMDIKIQNFNQIVEILYT